MTRHWQRWGPISGLLLCITWSPMAIAIPRLPDLGSAARVEAFWRANQQLMQGVILSTSVGFLFLLLFLGALVELLRTAGAPGAAIWTAFASVLNGIAAPVGVYLLWIFSVSLWWLIEQNRIRRPKPCESASAQGRTRPRCSSRRPC